MKILMMASGTPHSSLTHRIVALGRELVRRGHEVTMIAPSLDRHSRWQLDQPATLDGIRMVYPRQLRTRSVVMNLAPYVVSAAVAVVRQRADVVYLYKPTPATIVGLLAKWLKGTPVVLDMDDLGSEVMAIEGQPAAMWRLVAACERLAARQAARIVAASRLLERELTARFLARKAVLRLPNGVDASEFVPLGAGGSQGAGEGSGRRPRIVFLGALGRTRIVAPLLEALPAVVAAVGSEAVQVEILGDGPVRAELEALAERLGVAANVQFRGWTTFDQLHRYVAAGDIAICMMPEERTTAACSNQKVFQYFALGLAGIVSNVGDLPLYADGGRAALVVPAGDVSALSASIIKLIREPQTRAGLAARGRELAETRYAWSTLTEQLEGFVRSAL